ncbi:MAG: DUF47 family protein [Chloroflexi bacterium]|nr:DUF47 family protein [Chloroflexota bacterium]
MSGAIRRLASELSGHSSQVFSHYVVKQLRATIDAAELVREVVEGMTPVTEARMRIKGIENDSDRTRGELVLALSRAFTTPIDREDLFRLSRSVDDVLDNLRDFLREADLFGVKDLTPCAPLLPPVLEALERLSRAAMLLTSLVPEVSLETLAARKAGNLIRRNYEEELAQLFERPLTGELLKQRELLRRLDVVGLRIGEAADALADGYIKRR